MHLHCSLSFHETVFNERHGQLSPSAHGSAPTYAALFPGAETKKEADNKNFRKRYAMWK